VTSKTDIHEIVHVTLLVPARPPLPGISLDARTKACITISCALNERRRRVPNSLIRQSASNRVFALLNARSDRMYLSVGEILMQVINIYAFLAFVIPIGEDSLEVGFAETCHERHFPKYRLHPRTDDVNLELSFQVIF